MYAFLGLANFYCYFIYNYSDITTLLIWLTQKDTSWNFNFSCCDTFNTLKKVFTFTLILTHWIPKAQIIMETNTLKCILTAIFLIITEEKNIYPVTFYSHIFKTIKLNYDIHNKELLTMFKAFCIWCYYLEELELLINIITDYKNLKYFLTTKILFHYWVR